MNKKILISFCFLILINLLEAEFDPNKILAQDRQVIQKADSTLEIVQSDKENLKEITILYCNAASQKDSQNLKLHIVTLKEYKKIGAFNFNSKIDKKATDSTTPSANLDRNNKRFDIDVGETFSFLYDFNYNYFAQTFPDYIYKMKLAIKDFDSVEIKDGRGLVKVRFSDGYNYQQKTFYFVKNIEEKWKISEIF